MSTYRDTVRIAVFGTLWGVVEITLGTLLKGLRLPLGGALLACIGAVIALTGSHFIRMRGSILMMGGAAGLIKLFSLGTVVLSPFIAILAEAALLEAGISVLGRNKAAYMAAGAVAVTYTAVHPLLVQGLLLGAEIYTIYVQMLARIADVLGMGSESLIRVIIVWGILHAALGTAAGWLASLLPSRVEEEFRKIRESKGSPQ